MFVADEFSEVLAVEVPAKVVHQPMIDGTDTAKEESQCTVITGDLSRKGRMYIPAIDALPGKVISLFRDIPESGHCGARKTPQL
jgi:hypothetical protein